jgi:serine/threonine protein kinase
VTTSVDYGRFRDGKWRVWVHVRSWDPSIWARLREVIEREMASGRPHMKRLTLCGEGRSAHLLLKLYPPEHGVGQLKDFFRVSKALRYWRHAVSLSSRGFLTPVVWAAGERRTWRRLEMAFIVTELLPAQSLSVYLWGNEAEGRPQLSVHEKRLHIRELGRQVGRMHRLGFVHGDLVVSNILVRPEANHALYYYIDHDRTLKYPRWLPQSFWKRNLIQLNRLILPGITPRDRLRFFHAYIEGKQRQYGGRERRLLRWLARRTLARRRETRAQGRELRAPRARDYGEVRIGSD